MITIHHEKETDFSKNGYGAIDDYVMSQEVTWEMNGQFYAYLEYPAFLDKSAYLVNKNILRVPVPFMEDQLFRIYRVRKVLGFIQVEARHIFYDLMDNLIEDTNIVGKTGSQAIQQLLGATQYEHRFIGFSDISTSNNARMVRYNPVEALLDDSKANTFVSRWGGEVVRDNFVIRMVRQMGTDRGVRIQHRKDLTAYIATIDESTVVTRIMPVGFDGLKLPELYIDSPLLDPDNPKIDVIRYENVKAAIGEYADDNGAVPLEEAYELLRNHTKAEFSNNHIDEPEMTVTVNFVTLHNTKEYADFAQLQEIHQGDVVRVSVPDEDFEITSRLVAFTSDPLQDNHYTSTTLGNHVYEFTSSTNSVSTLRNEVEALRESVVEVRQSANGKNQSFWGEADPNTLNLNAILGDTYFRSVGEEDVIYQYVEVDGERYWKEIINTANTSEVKKEVERVAEEAEKLADDITEAQQSADDAKRDAGLALTASEALEIITQETASQLSDTRGLLATVESNASETLAKASEAASQAGQAFTDAQTAMDNAQSALSKASDTESTVSTLSKEVDTVAGEVKLKAEQTEVDTLSGTVSTHSTTLTQQATAISSKAAQTEVDTVKDTVSTHTSTLSQHAKDISARLTQTQVNNLVNDKGYSTVSYVDTQMTATAGAIRTEMTAVEGKIPTQIGGRNHAKGTSKEFTHVTVGRYSGSLTDAGATSQYIYNLEELGVQPGDTMTVSMYVGESEEGYGGGFRIDDQSGQNTYSTYKIVKNGYVSETFTILEGTTIISLYTTGQGHSGASGNFRLPVKELKFEKGNIRTDWTPAPEDMATSQQVSSIEQKANSIQALVGTTKESVARAVMTSNLWETEVSKVIDSELEQEYETKLSPIYVLNETEHNSGETFSLGKYFNYSGLTRDVPTHLQTGVKHVLEITMPATQNKGQFVYVQAKNLEGKWESIGANLNLPTGQFRITHEFTSLVFATSTSDYRLVLENGGNPPVTTIYSMKIYRNDEVQVPIEGTNTGAISSQITQLYNMINLSILGKDGAMSRIAMGEEGIQIDGKLLHITAKTYIDDAVIKSAMIDTLDAGKITTGELNASLIRVVNLDAKSIAGNEASFISALFSGTKSTLQITGGGVRVLDNSGRSSTYLDSTGIEISRAGVNLGKMQYVTNTSATGDLNGMHGIVMRPNRGSYFAVSYLPTAGTTESVRRFAVSGQTGNVYIHGLIKPSEQHSYGIDITWGEITGRDTNVRIMNHNRTGGIQINSGDISYLTSSGWRSLNDWIN